MRFEVEGFDVTVQFGRPEVKYFKGEDGKYRTVHFFAPEALIHPAFKKEFEEYVVRCIKMHTTKVGSGKYLPNGDLVSNYIPPRIIRSGYSAYELRKRIEKRVGDIEEAKEAWDYNKAPNGVVKTGKFGDLKAFLEMRKGGKLRLGDL
ncbi:phosphonate metabolim protein, transferasehexapeptide repeat family [Salmonella phage SSBI34]|nr:phosphonate metabolim protein, transferasehexapeptide repeat family [Salmonella phage SSBI34]